MLATRAVGKSAPARTTPRKRQTGLPIVQALNAGSQSAHTVGFQCPLDRPILAVLAVQDCGIAARWLA